MQITNNRTQYNNYNNFIPTKKKVINFTSNELQKTSKFNIGHKIFVNFTIHSVQN